MKIKNHKLFYDSGEQVPFTRSPNQSKDFEPKYLCLHYTAGPSLEGAVRTLTNKSRKASAHLALGRDSKVHQLVGFARKSWHAGRSEWKGLTGLNKYSFGIEIVNSGLLKPAPGGKWKTWYGKVLPDDEVEIHLFKGKERGWHAYTEEQIDRIIEIGEVLFDRYNLEDVIDHAAIAPKRKLDVGPAFPLEHVRSVLVGRHNEEADWQEPIYFEQDHLALLDRGDGWFEGHRKK